MFIGCVNILPKVALNYAAAGLEPASRDVQSPKSNALTITPSS